MDAETVQEIAKLAVRAGTGELVGNVTLSDGTTHVYQILPTENGRQLGAILQPPKLHYIEVTTLTGLVDALDLGQNFNPDDYFIHVNDYLTVTVKEQQLDEWNQRNIHIIARHQLSEAFRFDYYYTEPQKFIIALQVAFLQTEELLYLIRLASNLKAGNTVQTQDDGFSQTVTIKTGETTSADAKIPPRIKLVPLRTFPEASPVESEFLIRLQQSPQGVPSIGLFDVSGKQWMNDSMQSIKKWLVEHIDKQYSIIA